MIRYLIPKPETLEELKTLYKRLAFQNHPDRGGNQEVMKAINNEYDALFPILKNIHKSKEGTTYTKETTETPDAYREIINTLLRLHMDKVDIELVGSFLWITGNTKPYKDHLKKLSFKWSQNKIAWYLAPEGYQRLGKRQFSLDEIRAMYDSTKIVGKDEERTVSRLVTA
jgi:hypothetical protein